MNAWDVLRRVASDRSSGAAELALRTADALPGLESERDVMRAARKLLRAHAAMAPLWRVFAAALQSPAALRRITAAIEDEAAQVARVAAGWALPKRAHVITHSWSSTVHAALGRAGRSRIESVTCSASLPGGEGRALVAKLRREGFEVRLIADSEMFRACEHASVVVTGADAVTEEAVINKVGTALLALAAREHGVACYALAGSSKLLPHHAWRPHRASAYEAVPLDLFDAVLTERGARRAPAIKRAASKIEIPPALLAAVR
ncbi:MAG: hypothetical protein NVSMB57_06100 [Actinomycetota bacterium]